MAHPAEEEGAAAADVVEETSIKVEDDEQQEQQHDAPSASIANKRSLREREQINYNEVRL